MKQSFLIICFFSFLVASCGDSNSEKKGNKDSTSNLDPKNYFKDCKRLFGNAQKMDSILYTQTELDPTSANNAIKAFTDYAYYCGNDSLSPIFLIKTGQVATAINNIPQAQKALEKCLEAYPNFEGKTTAMFLLAQLYDEKAYLNNEEEARRLYEEIINNYPNSAEVESARGALKLIGKSDKEIMEELKKQAKEEPKVQIVQ